MTDNVCEEAGLAAASANGDLVVAVDDEHYGVCLLTKSMHPPTLMASVSGACHLIPHHPVGTSRTHLCVCACARFCLSICAWLRDVHARASTGAGMSASWPRLRSDALGGANAYAHMEGLSADEHPGAMLRSSAPRSARQDASGRWSARQVSISNSAFGAPHQSSVVHGLRAARGAPLAHCHMPPTKAPTHSAGLSASPNLERGGPSAPDAARSAVAPAHELGVAAAADPPPLGAAAMGKTSAPRAPTPKPRNGVQRTKSNLSRPRARSPDSHENESRDERPNEAHRTTSPTPLRPACAAPERHRPMRARWRRRESDASWRRCARRGRRLPSGAPATPATRRVWALLAA